VPNSFIAFWYSGAGFSFACEGRASHTNKQSDSAISLARILLSISCHRGQRGL